MYLYITRFEDIDKAKEDILREYSKTCIGQVSIDRLANGKPVLLLDKKPIGDISISHTENVLIMAFSELKVGVDIERNDRKISQKLCDDIKKWTQIEAYGKYLGSGITKSLIKENIPQGLVESFFWEEYVVSVASEDKKLDIIKLTR